MQQQYGGQKTSLPRNLTYVSNILDFIPSSGAFQTQLTNILSYISTLSYFSGLSYISTLSYISNFLSEPSKKI